MKKTSKLIFLGIMIATAIIMLFLGNYLAAVGFLFGFLGYLGLYAEEHVGAKNLIYLEHERMKWASRTFPEATSQSSLEKLKEEIKEVEELLNSPRLKYRQQDLAEEYADCLMCILDSAGRIGIQVEEVIIAFEIKTEINKGRTWIKNPDNTYSHVK